MCIYIYIQVSDLSREGEKVFTKFKLEYLFFPPTPVPPDEEVPGLIKLPRDSLVGFCETHYHT